MVLSILKIKPLPGKKTEAFQILQSMCEPLRLKHGCLNSQVFQSCGHDDVILYLEYWKTMDIARRHIQSDLYRRVLTVMELSQETPFIQFIEFSSPQGIELIQALRESSEN